MRGILRPSDRPLKRDFGLSPELVREARLDQVTRLIRGAYVIPLILILVWATTSFVSDHPRLFWGSAAAIITATAMRTIVALLRERIYVFRPALLARLGISTICLGSGATGLLFASALCFYGFGNWMFTLMLIWNVGVASASTVSFAPNFKLLQLNIFLLLVPVLVESLRIGGKQGNTFAFMAFILLIFLQL